MNIPSEEKENFISIVSAVNPLEALNLQDILNTYDDLVNAILRQLNVFSDNNAYLTRCIATILDDSELQAAGIFYNKTDDALLTNPKVIINSTYSTGIAIATVNSSGLYILGPSNIELVTMEMGRELGYLFIGSGAIVNVADSTASGALIRGVDVKCQRNNAGKLNAVKFGSKVYQVLVDPGAYYGGYKEFNPEGDCTSEPANFAYSNVTHNSVVLTWDALQQPHVRLDVIYKKTEDNEWKVVTPNDGEYKSTDLGFVSFSFGELEKDTFYDFRLRATCLNGGTKETATQNVQTAVA